MHTHVAAILQTCNEKERKRERKKEREIESTF